MIRNFKRFQNFRYWVSAPGSNFLDPTAGFTEVSIPTMDLGEATYREGQTRYTQKQPGIPTIGDISLKQGVARRQSKFFEWVQICAETGEYRTDFDVWHFHRADPGPVGSNGTPTNSYRFLEAWAKTVKLTGDLSSTSNDISIAELTISVERIVPITKVPT